MRLCLWSVSSVRTCDVGGDAKGGEKIATLALAEHDGDGGPGGQTALVLALLYSSKEAGGAAIASAVERGMAADYESHESWLATAPSEETKSYAA